jgi:protein phosphatase
VADGVGGAKSGSEASRLAKDTFIKAYFAAAAGTVPQRLQSAAALANSAVYNRAQELGGETMATTLVAAAILPTGETHIVNVGDSRAYLYRTGEVKQITRDHNVAALVEGNLDEASQAQAQNRLTRCIGADETTIADAFQIKLAAGEHLLLCSDGLTKHLNGDAELEQHLRRPNQAQATAAALVSLANERGGTDNITVMLIKFGADRARLPAQSGEDLPTIFPPPRPGRWKKKLRQLRQNLPTILAAALALVLVFLLGRLYDSKYNPFATITPTPAATELPKIRPTKIATVPATEAVTATETETPTAAAAVAAPTEPLPTTVPPSPDATSVSTAEPAATPTISATARAPGTPVAARTPGTCNWTIVSGDLIDEIAKAILRAEGYATPQGEQVRDKRNEIAKQNDLPNPDALKLGQPLKLTWPDNTKIINGDCPRN